MYQEDEPTLPESETEEYHFSENEEEGTDVFGTPGASNVTDSGANIRQIALMAVGLILVVFTVYKMMGMFTGKKAKVDVPQQVVQPITSTDSGTSAALTRLRQQLQSIESGGEGYKSQFQTLDASVSNVKEAVVDINSKLADINYTIQNLSHTIQEQQKAIEALKISRKSAKRAKRAAKAVNKYRIEAMIPGRAWLRTDKNVTITVGRGSRIPGYGTVRAIDVMAGVVNMSSGRVIRYGSEDK